MYSLMYSIFFDYKTYFLFIAQLNLQIDDVNVLIFKH